MPKKHRVPQSELLAIAKAIASRDHHKAQELCRSLGHSSKRGTWRYHGQRFADWLDDTSAKPSGQYFVKGNSKLPFYKFSALPIVTCPGAGQCAKWCYSLKAWRYPSAFFAQARNTVLLLEQSPHLAKAFEKLPKGVPLRLYVDGDFDSITTLDYWFTLLRSRPDLKAYGYSKSFALLASYKGQWPDNYRLNLSSGASSPASEAVKALPITRGRFLALQIPGHLAGQYDSKEYKLAVRTAAKEQGIKGFVCPGKCGTCTKHGHACGLDSFKGLDILIGIH